MVKCISTEYRLTKTKVITTTNECKGTYQKEPIRNRGKNRRENPGDQDAICVSFASDWLRGCRDEISNYFRLSIGNCSIKQIQDLLLAERKRYLEFCERNSYWSRFTSNHASSNSFNLPQIGRHATRRNVTRSLPLNADANRFCLLMHAQSSILYVSPHSCGQLCAIVSVMWRYSALFKMVLSKVYMILFCRRLMLV